MRNPHIAGIDNCEFPVSEIDGFNFPNEGKL
jgi:hypothetical protein